MEVRETQILKISNTNTNTKGKKHCNVLIIKSKHKGGGPAFAANLKTKCSPIDSSGSL